MKTVIHYNTSYQVQPFVYTSLKLFLYDTRRELYEKIRNLDLMNDPFTDKYGNIITRVPVNVSINEINAVKFLKRKGIKISGDVPTDKTSSGEMTFTLSNEGERYFVDVTFDFGCVFKYTEVKDYEFGYEIAKLRDKLGSDVNHLGELGKLITRKINNYVGL